MSERLEELRALFGHKEAALALLLAFGILAQQGLWIGLAGFGLLAVSYVWVA